MRIYDSNGTQNIARRQSIVNIRARRKFNDVRNCGCLQISVRINNVQNDPKINPEYIRKNEIIRRRDK